MNSCRCPYCGKKISYFSALVIRRRGEYYCKRCKKESNIHISKTIWVMFLGVFVFALLILGYYYLMTDREDPWFILFVAVPFILFYLFAPFFVRLRPMKKFQDSLYDTDMMNPQNMGPDPTMAASAKTAPAFVDDIVLGDEEYKPAINSDVFNAIKEERRVVADTDGGTKAFDKFENISSGQSFGDTKPVGDFRSIPRSDDNFDVGYDDPRYM